MGGTADPGTVRALAARLRDGTATSAGLVEELLDRADAADGVLGAYAQRFDEQARAAARAADAELARGVDRGPLAGIPVAVKDMIGVREAGVPRDPAAARLLPAGDAAVVARLRAAGAVVLGTTSSAQFGFGVPVLGGGQPVPRNPWDTDRWAGGSSSGSANGVAAGLFPAALGTDTAGSLRLPAAACGVSALKPTHGLVHLGGVMPAVPTMDAVGPIGRSADDLRLLLDALAPGALRPRSEEDPRSGLRGVRIGVVRDGEADPERDAALDDAVGVLSDLGAEVRPLVLPLRAEFGAIAVVTMARESYAVHRDGFRAHWASYAPTTHELPSYGLLLTEADYERAQEVRAVLRRRVAELFGQVDLVASATAVSAPPRVDELASAHAARPGRFARSTAAYWNVTGNPALTIPMGFAGGLPVGLQLAGRLGAERDLLAAGVAYQSATDWHRRRPPLPSRRPSDGASPSARERVGSFADRPRMPFDDAEVRRLAGVADELREQVAVLTAFRDSGAPVVSE